MTTETPGKTALAYVSAVWLNVIAWFKDGFDFSALTMEQRIAVVVGSLTAVHLSLRIYAEIKTQFFKKGSNP